jgi:hypothetical protein
LFFIAIVAIVSCQKEVSADLPANPTTTGSLNGNWKFLYLNTITESIVEERDRIDVAKAITTSNYTSQNNAGAMRMDGSVMSFSNLSYDINSIAKSYIYFNNELEDSLEFPITFSLPATNTQTKYKVIGTDSIYMEGGTVFNTGGGTVVSQGQGARFRFEGDKLIMTSKGEQSKIENLGNTIRTQRSKATSIVTYQKQ